jgi:CheY-like chemotaxis protein
MDRRLLVVDDEVRIRDLFVRLLRRRGYRVSTAATAREAIDLVRTGERLDAIVLDLVMRDSRDLSIVHRMLELVSPERLIVVSGKLLSAEDSIDLAALGVSWYRKPFRNDEILEAVDRAANGVRRGVRTLDGTEEVA